jgi:hypothetical protein
MTQKFLSFIYQNKYIQKLIFTGGDLLRHFAWLLNPFLSVRRFWLVRSIGMKTANYCFDSEKNMELIEHSNVPYYQWASFELRITNYVYGHAKVLKQYAGLPDIYPVKVHYSHGIDFTHGGFDPQLPRTRTYDFSIPVFLATGRYQENLMRHYHPHNTVYVIGSPFLYAENLFSEEYVQKEKNRLGKNLLVFPAHSTLVTNANYKKDDFIEFISRFKNRFDSIRICLYYKDIEQHLHQLYREHGFECVCAGHGLDCNFISRLKGLLSICDATITNKVGSHVGYSIAMDKPVLMNTSEVSTLVIGTNHNLWSDMEATLSPAYQLIVDQLQANEELIITDEFRETIEPFWGLREKKTKEELRQIFFEAEELFRKSPKRHTFLTIR